MGNRAGFIHSELHDGRLTPLTVVLQDLAESKPEGFEQNALLAAVEQLESADADIAGLRLSLEEERTAKAQLLLLVSRYIGDFGLHEQRLNVLQDRLTEAEATLDYLLNPDADSLPVAEPDPFPDPRPEEPRKRKPMHLRLG